MLHVSGLACPWNVYNSYNELMKPGAFAKFIAKHPEGVRMGFMHEFEIGHWDTLKETPEGLWVSGRVTEPEYAAFLKHADDEFRELSITYEMPLLVESEARFNSQPSWLRSKLARRYKILPAIEVPEAFLDEISIVDDGAFPGTHLDIA